jgi:hypothetical protein
MARAVSRQGAVRVAANGTQIESFQLYDGRMLLRQIQTPSWAPVAAG